MDGIAPRTDIMHRREQLLDGGSRVRGGHLKIKIIFDDYKEKTPMTIN